MPGAGRVVGCVPFLGIVGINSLDSNKNRMLCQIHEPGTKNKMVEFGKATAQCHRPEVAVTTIAMPLVYVTCSVSWPH